MLFPLMRVIEVYLTCALVIGLCGCGAPPLVEHRAGCVALVRPTRNRCTLTLFSDSERVVSTTSEAGDEVGFARTGEQLLAVNGSDRWPLVEANYRWVEETYHQPWFQPQPHPTEKQEPKTTPDWVKCVVTSLDQAAAHWK